MKFSKSESDTMLIDDGLNIQNENYDIFIVERYNNYSGGGRSLQSRDNNWLLGLWGSQYGFYTNGWLGYYSADNNWHLINGKSTGTETLYFNGAFRKTINSGSGRPYRLAINGGGMYAEYSDSSIAEIIIFDKVLTDSERIQINYYLANKWNLLDKIDSDGDGHVDSFEISKGTSPTDSNSKPAPLTGSKTYSINLNWTYNHYNWSSPRTVASYQDTLPNNATVRKITAATTNYFIPYYGYEYIGLYVNNDYFGYQYIYGDYGYKDNTFENSSVSNYNVGGYNEIRIMNWSGYDSTYWLNVNITVEYEYYQ